MRLQNLKTFGGFLLRAGNLISTVTTLTTLEAASSSGVDDTLLGVVGVYCPHLRHLDVSYTAVTNRGLECLVLPQVCIGTIKFYKCGH
jgi:hypothetical protein